MLVLLSNTNVNYRSRKIWCKHLVSTFFVLSVVLILGVSLWHKLSFYVFLLFKIFIVLFLHSLFCLCWRLFCLFLISNVLYINFLPLLATFFLTWLRGCVLFPFYWRRMGFQGSIYVSYLVKLPLSQIIVYITVLLHKHVRQRHLVCI